MGDAVLQFLGVLAGALLIFFGNRFVNRANANAVDVKTFQELVDKVGHISDDLLLVKSSNTALWSYVYDLIEFIISKGHIPPQPPAELDTNPKLIKLLNKVAKAK